MERRVNEITFSVRPTFVGWMTLVSFLPFQLFLSVWCGGFFGYPIQSLDMLYGNWWLAFVVPGGLAFFALPIVFYIARKRRYARMEYRFYGDRLEFDAGFSTISRKTISFQEVKRVSLRKGILQRLCGLGTIYLWTAAGSVRSATPFGVFFIEETGENGVALRDIPDVDDAFERIRAVVRESRLFLPSSWQRVEERAKKMQARVALAVLVTAGMGLTVAAIVPFIQQSIMHR